MMMSEVAEEDHAMSISNSTAPCQGLAPEPSKVHAGDSRTSPIGK